MRDIIIIVNENECNECNEDERPGEEWMYDDDVNSGLY
ncbi:hypothetical protein LCGC14_1685370 [marine sediment metagenome]|uniref:Uncharacterized protein n=1 Tax=marine sediment metagenome TaxID=412755 RepID=A0A0F9KMF4_9ZZZZ